VTGRKIGLALGSGAARGWAHIGVLRALDELGIEPDIVCGTSIGAAVGAAYLTGQLDELQSWAQNMGLLGMLGIIDVTFRRGGLVAAERVFERFRNAHTDVRIEELPKPYAAVATDLATGREIWLREGPMLDAVCASAAMPGVFPAVRTGQQWLVDGALVNPVPVSLCRALGADVVIAVNLNSELSAPSRPVMAEAGVATSTFGQLTKQVSTWIGRRPGIRTRFLADQIEATANEPAPNVLEILTGSIDIMQDRITRSRLAGEPPDVLVTPRLGHVGILEFDRAAEVVEIGYAAASIMRPQIELALRRA
jgi:NTE family protein